jgi:hypothetical protein
VRSPFLGSSLSICGVTSSGPGDFLLLRRCTASRTSWRVKGTWFGDVSLDRSCCVISVSGSLWWGENTCARWAPNKLAFSWSLFAQTLLGVNWLRMGGMAVFGRLVALIGFQIELSCVPSRIMYFWMECSRISLSFVLSLWLSRWKVLLSSG